MTPPPDGMDDLPFSDPVAPRSEVSDQILRDCTDNLKKKRGLGLRSRLALSIGVSGLVLSAFMVMSTMSPAGGVAPAAIYGVLGWGLVQAVLLFFGLGRPPARRASWVIRAGGAVAVAVGFVIILAIGAREWRSLAVFSADVHAEAAAQCAMMALVVGTVVAGAILMLWSRTDPFTPSVSGSVAGLGGGLVGAVGVGVVCPVHEGWHLTLGHGLMVVALGLVGWVVGRRVMAP